MRQIVFHIVTLLSLYQVFGQEKTVRIYVQNEAGIKIENAFVFSEFQEKAFIVAKPGYVDVNISKESGGVYVSSSGYYPEAVYVDFISDSIIVKLSKYKRAEFNDIQRNKGFSLMRKVNDGEENIYQQYKARILEQRSLRLDSVPIEILGLSGRLFPSNRDTGNVLTSLRLSDFYYLDQNNSYEEVLSKVDSGLFKRLGEIGLNRIMLDPHEEHIYLDPFSSLLFESPLGKSGSEIYNYYVLDSIQLNHATLYRVKALPKEDLRPLFVADMWIESNNYSIIEADLKAYQTNQLDFIDSLELRFYWYSGGDEVYPKAQQVSAAISILNFKLQLKVNATVLDFDQNVELDSIKKKRFLIYNEKSETDLQTLGSYYGFLNSGANPFDDSHLQSSISKRRFDENANFLNKQADLWRSILLTGNDYKFRKGYISVFPAALSVGYNTVEGYYFNLRSSYIRSSNNFRFKLTPYLRYGFSSKKLYPKVQAELNFNYENPIKIVAEGGSYIRQFNRLEPIQPVINTLYSLGIERNYMKIYQRDYLKLLVDKEVLRGLEMVMSLNVERRTALFNNSFESILGDGSRFTPNNPNFPPVIDSTNGFVTHWANIFRLEMYYQFGRKYTFENNRLKKVESSLPRLFMIYQKGLSYEKGMPDYTFIAGGVGSKTKIRDYGILEFDLSIGGFGMSELVHFPDFKHFNGVQTAFINRSWDGWTDVRQFSTLPYYDYSTNAFFTEFHIKQRFLGTLLNRSEKLRKYQIHSYAGYNFLYTDNKGVYNEIYFGLENLLKVFNVQFALGMDSQYKLKPVVLLGFNFDYSFYIESRNN